jgi:hypothetical protein
MKLSNSLSYTGVTTLANHLQLDLPSKRKRKMMVFFILCGGCCRSQCPSGLGPVSIANRLLGLRVRIPPGHGWLSLVGVVCVVR